MQLKIERGFYDLTLPFTTQSNDFRTSTNGLDMDLIPQQMPNQTILLSSAESTDTYLFDMYKLCFEKMLMGDDRYFVADISADHSLHPYINGKATKPLLTQQVIDDAMATNPYRAMREQIKNKKYSWYSEMSTSIPFNCWQFLKIIILKRRYEIWSGVKVSKEEKNYNIIYG